jgi:hypothetical protein
MKYWILISPDFFENLKTPVQPSQQLKCIALRNYLKYGLHNETITFTAQSEQ